MKKIILLIFLTISLNIFSQEIISEGIVIQKQTVSSSNEEVNAQLKLMGEMRTKTFFKGNKTRSEMSNVMAGETITIMDNDKKEMLILINNSQLGKKYATKSLSSNEDDFKNIVVTPNDETKTILGYICKRYDVTTTTNNVETKLTLYTTNKISAMSEQLALFGNKMEGFPLYLEISANQMGMDMIIKMEAIEIKNEKVSDDKFSIQIPDGYEKGEFQLGN